MKCRVCGNNMDYLERIPNAIEGHATLAEAPFLKSKRSLDIYQCKICSHIQAEYHLDEKYYEDYVLFENQEGGYYGDASQAIVEHISRLSRYANTLNKNSSSSVLDIGCGRGDALEIAKKYFDICEGVEASEMECDSARKRGYKIYRGYFDKNMNFERKYGALISTMVFEHLEEPFEALKKAWEIMEWDGVGYINIPNGEMIISQGLYHQINTEHINYYTPLSIAHLINKTGFDLILIECDDNLIELNAYFKKVKKKESIVGNMQLQKSAIERYIEGSTQITVWGAGSKACTYADLVSEIEISHIVDSSSNKVGKYVSGISVPIEMVSQRILDVSDVVIVFASTYNEDIMKQLKEKYQYSGKVIYFQDGIVMERIF